MAMAFTTAQHKYFASQHRLAAKGRKSMYAKATQVSAKEHYYLAEEHDKAARGQPSKFDGLDNGDRPVKAPKKRHAETIDLFEGVKLTLSRGRTPLELRAG